jgi:preprotein translocase SecE subunit
VARETRAERRARRQQQGEPALAGAAGAGAGGRGGKPPVRLAPDPPSRPDRPGKAQEERGGFRFGLGIKRFIEESWGELRKVEWPSQSHVIQGTVVVLIACAILGTYIYVADIAFKYLVHSVLLR